MSRRLAKKRFKKRVVRSRQSQLERLEERIVLSGDALTNVLGRYADQVVVPGDVRTVGFTVAADAFANGPAFVRIDVAPQRSVSSELPGDFNRDRSVNSADYVVWRQGFGTSGPSSADGNGNGAVDTADYVLWRKHQGAVGAALTQFNPAVAILRDAQGTAVGPVQAAGDSPLGAGSFGVFQLAAGTYTIDVAGEGVGAFEARLTLIGDVDGDRDVDLSDLNAIRTSMQNGSYSASADVNLDGVITSFDYSYARRNNDTRVSFTPAPQVTLAESNSLASRYSQMVDLSSAAGSRTLTIDIDANFDRTATSGIGDLFQIYLVDPATGTSLLTGSTEAAALFTLGESRQELALGRVTYSDGRVQVDVTGLTAVSKGELVLQLLSGDVDEGSRVNILDVRNEVGDAIESAAALNALSPIYAAGPAVDLGMLHATSDLAAVIGAVRFDPDEGLYRAQLRVKNNGAATGREVVAVFAGLPSGVTSVGASGVDATRAPYWNLHSAIANGGLQAGAISGAIEIAFQDPAVLRLILNPQLLVGGPNRAPEFAPLASITLHPGEVIETNFLATDRDGDSVQFSVHSAGRLPTSEFSPTGRLTLRPGLDEVGTYEIEVTASDGVLTTMQPLTVVVAADADTTTRISGIVLDTNGRPLEGVPVEIAGFGTRTAADGSFTIALPTKKTPTEAFNISVPAGDVYLDPFNTGTQEITLRRARYDVTTGTSVVDPREHPSLVSSFIDASVVYGSDEARAAALRTFTDGKLKMSAGNLLPLNNAATFGNALLENDNEGREDATALFVSGDVRTNENVALIAMHTILVREHNRLAETIKATNPTWTDEMIYQEARRLVGAMLQNITYAEYLPLLLGENALAPYTGYDATVDPRESAIFASAAFRLGHTQLPPEIARLDASGQSLAGGALALRNAFFTTAPVKTDGIEPLLRGLAATPMQEIDTKIVDDVRNFLFGPAGSGGMDLASLNIQRGRDVGLPSYAQARIDFGLAPITSFAQITSNGAVQSALQSVYGTVDKIDVWVGGLAEDHVAGAQVGPLFRAILKDQFERTRNGDRFWFENGQFTSAELAIIRGTTLEGLIERNAPGVDLPTHAFTTGAQPAGPAPTGNAAGAAATEYRSIDGLGNNLADPGLGAAGSNVLRNFTNGYGDGVSTSGGADRPGARVVSNAVNAQTSSLPNSLGITSLFTFWGQLLDHDLGLTPGGVSDTLKIEGNLRPVGADNAAYPFVAEKMGLMLGHAVFPGVNNVIARPIYLPAIDVAHSVAINPAQDTMVTTAAIPGASLMVKAGTLKDRQGNLFTGNLSITEVPRELTPAALPSTLLPDLVVTIQPADMVLSTPAPLSLPNGAGWAPGTKMDLWSINPITGFFDIVGQGQVSADGSVVNTISGGIRNSSWHMFSPTVGNDLTDESPDLTCNGEDSLPFNSRVGLLTGALIESHDLTAYESLGVSRGLTLVYDSKRAQPQAELAFSLGIGNSINGANQGNSQALSVLGSASIYVGGTEIKSVSTSGNANGQLWSIEALSANDIGGRVHAGLSVSLKDVPTGLYPYTIKAGGVRGSNSGMAGTLSSLSGKVATVNGVASAFGAGWGLAGLTEIHEAGDGSVLLVDGDGSESIFGAPATPGGAYMNPMGHFGSLVKQPNGTFVHTMTDQTVFRYNSENKLASITDRTGNVTRFEYSGGRLNRIVDPAGLATTFQYVGNLVSSITDPAGRVTMLNHDGGGNLTSIADPDTAVRAWQYDASHRMTGETTERGFQETTLYNSAGMVSGAIRADGTVLSYAPALAAGLALGNNPLVSKVAGSSPSRLATLIDGNGNATSYEVDKAGQYVSAKDGAGGFGTVMRNGSNLISTWLDGRGNRTALSYDANGNPLQTQAEIIGIPTDTSLSSRDQVFRAGVLGGAVQTVSGDFNGDGHRDLVFVTRNFSSLTSPFFVYAALGSGNGLMRVAQQVFGPVSGVVPIIASADLNHDGRMDLIVAEPSKVSFLVADATGAFSIAHTETTSFTPRTIEASDFDRDGQADVVVAGKGTSSGLARVFFGDGAGGVRSKADLQGASQSFASIAISDFNKDGYNDVAAPDIISDVGYDVGAGTISIFLSSGGTAFLPRVSLASVDVDIAYLNAADLNSDSNIDLLGMSDQSGIVRLYYGDGTGGFSISRQLKSAGLGRHTELADFNSDGFADILTSESGTAEIYFGNAAGDLTNSTIVRSPVNSGFAWNEIADFNEDNTLDIVDSVNSIHFGDGTGQFFSVPSYTTSDPASISADRSSVELADVNNDMLFDIIETASNGDITVLLGNGDGSFATMPVRSRSQVGLGSYLQIADINEDGFQDIVSGYTYFQVSSNIVWLLGDGTGKFAFDPSHRVNLASSDTFQSILVDADGDNNLDIVIARNFSNRVSYLTGDGQGGFSSERPLFDQMQGVGDSLASGDFNGDHVTDFVGIKYDASALKSVATIYVGTGNGGYTAWRSVETGGTGSVQASDIDNDGLLDFFIQQDQTVAVYSQLPGGVFEKGGSLPGRRNVRQAITLDANRDGITDFALTTYTSINGSLFPDNRVLVFGGKADGTYEEPVKYDTAYGSNGLQSLVSADVDNDGDADLVVSTPSVKTVNVYLNYSRTTSVDAVSSAITYDPVFSRPTSRTDERGNVTNFTIDPANGNTTGVSGPENQRMTYTYTAAGLIDTMTDSLGHVTDYDYNALGRLTTVTYAKGTVDQGIVRYEYDLAGNQTAMVDENNHRTEYEYDARNRLTLVRDALGNETKYKYDRAGNVMQITDALGHVTKNDYDARNRLIRTTDFQNNVTQFAYDAEGNLIRVTDPLSHVTRHRYDVRNRRIETIDPDGGKTLFRYDADNNLIALTDPDGNRTLFFYDARNRLTKETDPLGKSISYKYDAADNLIEKKDRDGRVTRYVYDGLNRLKTETWVGDGNVITYSYDTESNLTNVADDFSRLSYTYDARYRVTSVDNHGSQTGGTPQAPRVVVNYAYDAASNILSVIDTINGSAGATTGYNYDALDRLTKLTQTGAGLSDKRVDFGYNKLSQTTSIDRSRNLAGTQTVVDTTYSYDTLNRLESISHDNAAGSAVAFYDYVYDDASRITRITDVDGVTNYGYDNRDELTSASHSDPAQADEQYDYDANGNRESSHLHGTSYVVGPGNRLLSDGTYNYAYDDEGNTVKRTEIATGNYREFTWDYRNRLVKVVDKLAGGTPTQVVEFTYDAFDRRISKSVDATPLDAVDAAFTSFVYDREDVILDFVDADGKGAAPVHLAERYLHGPGIDQVLAQDDGAGTTHWMLTDHLGSVRDLVTDAGTIADHVVFDSFGNADSPSLSRYGFTGREFDGETGLSYFRSRYLDSRSGVFLSQDSLRFGGGDTNLSRYVVNSPSRAVDPYGTLDIVLSGTFTAAGSFLFLPTLGVTGQGGLVIDTDHLLESGVFLSGGVPLGWHFGTGINFGFVKGDIEGPSLSSSFDAGVYGGTVMYGNNGINGLLVGIRGGGFGGNTSVTATGTYSIQDLLDALNNIIEAIWGIGGDNSQSCPSF